MSSYNVGVGQTYTTFSALIATLTLPEAGGTVFNVFGTITEDVTFLAADFPTNLTFNAATGEEVNGVGVGATIAGTITCQSTDTVFNNLRIWQAVCFQVRNGTADNCFFGNYAETSGLRGGTAAGMVVTNCIFAFSDRPWDSNGPTTGISFVNCTALNHATVGWRRCGVTNCHSYNNTGADYSTDINAGSTYCSDSDGTASTAGVTTTFPNRTDTDFFDFYSNNFDTARESTLSTANASGGPIGAVLSKLYTFRTVARGDTLVKLGIKNGSAAQGTATVTLNSQACTITTYPGSNGDVEVTVPATLASLYGSFPFVYTDNDATTRTSTVIPFTPAAGRQYVDLVGPITTSPYGLYNYEGTPAPVTGDQYEVNAATSPTSIGITALATSEIVLDSAPTVTQTWDNQVLRAATGVRSATWTTTLVVGAILTGTANDSITEDTIDGSTSIITLTADTWIAAGTGAIGTAAQTQSIIDLFVAAQIETLGWNNQVTGVLVRTSPTIATITWTSNAHDITAQETVTPGNIPNAVLTTGIVDLAITGSFTVDIVAAVGGGIGGFISNFGKLGLRG